MVKAFFTNPETQYPGILGITIFQDMRFFKEKMVSNMKGFGRIIYSMDMGFTPGLMVMNTRVLINWGSETEKGEWNMLMDQFIMVNGRMAKNMGKDSLSVKNNILSGNIPKEFYSKLLDDY